MPIYEYECLKCGGRFDVLVGRAGGAKPKCPRCKGRRVQRRFSSFGMSSGGKFSSSVSGGGCGNCGGG